MPLSGIYFVWVLHDKLTGFMSKPVNFFKYIYTYCAAADSAVAIFIVER